MVKVRTPVDVKMQKAFQKDTVKAAVGLVIVGLAGIITSLTIGLIFGDVDFYMIFVFVVFPVIGIVFLIILRANLKNIVRQAITNEYEFGEDALKVSSIKNDEVVGTQKVYYKDVYKVKEADGYYFIYINNATAFMIDKDCCSEDERAEIESVMEKLPKKPIKVKPPKRGEGKDDLFN